MTGAWESIIETRKFSAAAGVVLGVVAVLAGLAGVRAPELRLPAVVFSLLSAHAITGWILLGQTAKLQAALDMKRVALGASELSGKIVNMCAGDECEFSTTQGTLLRLRAHRTTTIEVLS